MAKVNRSFKPIPAEVYKLFRDTTSPDKAVAEKALNMYAQALQEPLREVLLSGPLYTEIFSVERYEYGVKPIYMLDWIVPGTEGNYVAYTVPAQGKLPRFMQSSDYIELPTYEIGASLDWNKRFAQVAGPQFMRSAQARFEKMFTKKLNDDAFHLLLMMIVDRGIVAYDAAAAANQFTKRLVSVGNLVMKRNAGGNSVTNNRKLTDIFMSLEAHEDVRNWGIDIVPDSIRARIYDSEDGLRDIFGTNLRPLFELGVGQEYQDYYTNTLSGTLPSGDSEIMIGLDLSTNDSFVMALTEDLSVEFDDERRNRIQGMFGFMMAGFGGLDGRRCMGLSC